MSGNAAACAAAQIARTSSTSDRVALGAYVGFESVAAAAALALGGAAARSLAAGPEANDSRS